MEQLHHLSLMIGNASDNGDANKETYERERVYIRLWIPNHSMHQMMERPFVRATSRKGCRLFKDLIVTPDDRVGDRDTLVPIIVQSNEMYPNVYMWHVGQLRADAKAQLQF